MITSRPWKNFAKAVTSYLPHDARVLVYRGLKKGIAEELDVTRIRNAYVQHGAIFFHVPKTGGTSISMQLYNPPAVANIGIVGMSQMFTAEEFSKALKFAFVRHPLDRLVSAFFHLKKTVDPRDEKFFARYGDVTRDGFSGFVDWLSEKEACYRHTLLIPQNEFICLGDRVMVDVLGRFENIAEDYAKIAHRIGLDERLPRLNATEHQHYTEYYDDRIRNIATRIYKRDFEIFGYSESQSS